MRGQRKLACRFSTAALSRLAVVALVQLALASMAAAQATMSAEPSAQDKQAIAEFNKRVNDYLTMRKKDAGRSPAQTSSPDKLANAQKRMAEKLRQARSGAKQGDIFTPPVADYFRKQIVAALSGARGAKIRASLRHAEPIKGVTVEINAPYPRGVPLQSTPPSLLLALPPLPKELEYRIVNDDLVLHDIATNLIVDFVPHAVPAA